MYYLGSNGEMYYTSEDDYETCEDLGYECEIDELTETCVSCGMPA
jgi:hypothetical protein